MEITKNKLDIPFNQLVAGYSSTETPREFIRNSEKVFGMAHKDIDNMPTSELHVYIEILEDARRIYRR